MYVHHKYFPEYGHKRWGRSLSSNDINLEEMKLIDKRPDLLSHGWVNEMYEIKAIQTNYRGFRFRSRLEARWAVFFDILNINWQYEPQGYLIDGKPYLPDFFLPDLNLFIEIKPTREEMLKAEGLLKSLAVGTGKRAAAIAGTPQINGFDSIFYHSNGLKCSLFLHPCFNCGTVLHGRDACNCTSDVTFIKKPSGEDLSLINFALEEAQGARFEHGENGRSGKKFIPSEKLFKSKKVYLGGAVNDDCPITGGKVPNEWRNEIFTDKIFWHRDNGNTFIKGQRQFKYHGPNLLENHGFFEIAEPCLELLKESNLLFFWINRKEQVGSLIEIGAAKGWDRPLFIAYANEELSNYFSFASELADVAIIAPDVKRAWEIFTIWGDYVPFVAGFEITERRLDFLRR